jgi:hypothetical protein
MNQQAARKETTNKARKRTKTSMSMHKGTTTLGYAQTKTWNKTHKHILH